jgi:hypothetical protein
MRSRDQGARVPGLRKRSQGRWFSQAVTSLYYIRFDYKFYVQHLQQVYTVDLTICSILLKSFIFATLDPSMLGLIRMP